MALLPLARNPWGVRKVKALNSEVVMKPRPEGQRWARIDLPYFWQSASYTPPTEEWGESAEQELHSRQGWSAPHL